MKTNMLVDLNNLTFITRFVVLPANPNPRKLEKQADVVLFVSMIKYIMSNLVTHKCDGLVIAADSKNVWRKDVYPEYKMKDKNEDPYYDAALRAADMVYEVFDQHTAAHTFRVPRCEADDIIGYWCKHSTNKSLILSNDSDYKQLHNEMVKQYSPTQKSFVVSTSPTFDLMLKCVRGDKNDNIRSAYPRVKTTVIQEAHDEPLAMMNFLETVLKDGTKVGDAYEFNRKLIDLTQQPPLIKSQIESVINNHTLGKFNQLGLVSYVGKTVGSMKYVDIFDMAPTAIKKMPIFKETENG